MEKVLLWPLRVSRTRFCFALLILGLTGEVEGAEGETPPYLPRLGPLPIRFLIPPPPVSPYLLPPLDLGEKTDAEGGETESSSDDKKSGEKNTKPERRVRISEMSSRPSAESGNAGISGKTPAGQDTTLYGPEAPGNSVEDLLPDGFDLNFDQSGSDRRDLSVFLNYFIGQGQKGQANTTAKPNANPAPVTKNP